VTRAAALVVGALAAAVCSACASAPPKWTRETPSGFQNTYVTGKGVGPTGPAARRAAISDGLAMLARRGQLRIELVRQVDTVYFSETLGPSTRSMTRRSTSTAEIATTGKAVDIQGLELVEEYEGLARGRYDAAVLLRMPKDSGATSPPGRAMFVARSLLLPGYGQFAQGEPAKGAGIMWTTAIFGAVAIGAEVYRTDRLHAAAGTGVQAQRDQWTSQANQARQVEIGAVGVAIAAWAYGVYDALAGPVRIYASRSSIGFDAHLPLR
jgi:hypothetical protein